MHYAGTVDVHCITVFGLDKLWVHADLGLIYAFVKSLQYIYVEFYINV